MTPAARRAELALAGVTIIWGTSFTLVKSALDDASTLTFLTIRFLCATAALAVFNRRAIADGSLRDGYSRRAGIVTGCFLALAYVLQTSGLRATSASSSAFLTALSIVLVPLAGAALHRHTPALAEWFGAAMALTGVGLMTLPGAGGFDIGAGDLLSIGGAVAFTGHILATGAYAPRVNVAAMNVTQFAFSTVVFALAAPAAEVMRASWTFRLAAAVLVTSVLCTALAYSVQAWAQRNTTPTRAALIFALEPVSAAATEWLVAGKVLSPVGFAGAALVLAAVLAAAWKPAHSRP
jgi:drug/metabolite transporter (DMT)-like permease